MRELADYLDAFDERRGRQGLRTRALGTTPSFPLILTPLPLVPAPTGAVASLHSIYPAADRARVDAQMWVLDAGWLGSAQWADMRMCVVGRGDVSGGTVTSPYAGPGTCRTPTGALADTTCNWGFWKIDRCDLDTASTRVFQFSRYLWAQARMRELLASKPVPGQVNDGPAAAWAWN